jgi:hypothetical protein
MVAPYRDEAPLAKREVPQTLECWLRDGDKGRWLRTVYVKVWVLLVVVGPLLALGAYPAAALVAVLGGVWIRSGVRDRKGAHVVFHVAGARVRVVRPAPAEIVEVTLDDLRDVRLDSKSASKNVTMARTDGVNTVFGMGSGHNIDIDIARIELVTRDEQSIVLAGEFLSASLSAETMRTIRLFLRAHGWKPADERPDGEGEQA